MRGAVRTGTLLLAAASALAGPAAAAQAAGGPPADPRTTLVLHERCTSAIDSRDLSLYANGTVRVRQGPPGGERLVLVELGHPELEAVRRRIEELDFTELRGADRGAEGEWTPECELELATRGGARHALRYGALDSGGLELDQLRRIVETLAEAARAAAYSFEIPASYRPGPGDRLERNDGLLFEVIGFTSDGKAVELAGVDQPVQVFVERDKLRLEFRRIVARAAP